MSASLFDKEPDIAKLKAAYDKLKTQKLEAVSELKTLADQGSVMSMIYLAHAFKHKQGGVSYSEDYEIWLKRAKEAGSAFAAYSLARLYLSYRRYSEAEENFLFSASLGFLPSIARLGAIYKQGLGVKKDLVKARKFLEEGRSKRHLSATFNLATLLMSGHFGLIQFCRGIFLYMSLPLLILKLSADLEKHHNADHPLKFNERIH